jgi:hypothetical protein
MTSCFLPMAHQTLTHFGADFYRTRHPTSCLADLVGTKNQASSNKDLSCCSCRHRRIRAYVPQGAAEMAGETWDHPGRMQKPFCPRSGSGDGRRYDHRMPIMARWATRDGLMCVLHEVSAPCAIFFVFVCPGFFLPRETRNVRLPRLSD